LEEALSLADEPADNFLALGESLESTAREDTIEAQLVQLRYFAGLAVRRGGPHAWRMLPRMGARARAWLYQEIVGALPEDDSGT
jgi:hypothetical protein